MPVYDLWCESCHGESEHIMGMQEHPNDLKCPHCGHGLRRENQAYYRKTVQISGDTCAGSVDYSNYYDESLGGAVRSRTHRRDLMKRKGLEDYAPSTEAAEMHKESRYIGRHAPRGDREALKARKELGRKFDRKRKERVIDEAFDKAHRSLDKGEL